MADKQSAPDSIIIKLVLILLFYIQSILKTYNMLDL
jgi:hypothetical protein